MRKLKMIFGYEVIEYTGVSILVPSQPGDIRPKIIARKLICSVNWQGA
jgi:hypothetical protein